MNSLLPTEAYYSEDWFARERELVMKPLWQFVAPKMLLKSPNAFVRRNVCGVDLVVQNFQGELRALDNLCLHRLNPLQQEPQGVRPLVCSYHGWSYDREGKVQSLPFQDEAYRLPNHIKQCLQLKRYALTCIGQLVFVNLSESPMPIEEQFSMEALQMLIDASEHFDDEVLIAEFKTQINWKLAYENLRDSLHPRFVHSRTLAQVVQFQTRMDEEAIAASFKYIQNGSESAPKHREMLRSFSGGGLNEPILEMPKYAWHEHVDRFGQADWYLNWLLYPNLHIASGSGGHSFIIEHHQPISAAQTNLTVYYVTARKKRRYPTSSAVLMAHLEGAERVLREDIDVMEKIQSGLRHGSPRPILGDFDHANRMVERWYMDVMDGRYVL